MCVLALLLLLPPLLLFLIGICRIRKSIAFASGHIKICNSCVMCVCMCVRMYVDAVRLSDVVENTCTLYALKSSYSTPNPFNQNCALSAD